MEPVVVADRARAGRCKALDALAAWVEGRYRVTPRIFFAARLDRLGFSSLRGSVLTIPWDAPVERVEWGIGYYVQRNVVLRATAQHNWRTAAGSPSARTSPASWRTGSDAMFRRIVAVLCHDAARRSRDDRQRPHDRWRPPRMRPSGAASSCGSPRAIRGPRVGVADIGMSAPTPRSIAAASSISIPRRARRSTRVRSRAQAGSAQRDVRAARARDRGRHDSRFPQQRSTYHNVFSLSKTKTFDLGTLRRRPLEVGPVRSPGHRPRVLRHPFAHERVHPRVLAPLFRRGRRRWALPARRTCRRAPTPWWPGTRRRRSSRGASSCRRPAATSRSTSPSAADDGLLVTHQPHLLRQRAAGGRWRSASRSTGSTSPSLRRPKTSCGAASRRPARCSKSTGRRSSDTSRREARLIADLPKLKAALDTKDPVTVQPIADEYQRLIGSDLFLVTEPCRPRPGARPAASRAAAAMSQRRRRIRQATDGHEAVLAVAAPWRRHPGRVGSKLILESELLGTVSVGFSLDEAAAARFKALTNSEIAFAVGGSDPGVDAAGAVQRLCWRRSSARDDMRTVKLGDNEYVVDQPRVAAAGRRRRTGRWPVRHANRAYSAVAHRAIALSERRTPRPARARRFSPSSPRRW